MNVMLDLETLGTSPGCIVLSIGAVVVEDPSRAFYGVLSTNHQRQTGLMTNGQTLSWWDAQSDEAKEVLRKADVLTESPKHVLRDFSDWFLAVEGTKTAVWGNGAAFDPPILEAVYAAYQLPAPWMFWNVRCYRTMKAMFPEVTPGKRDGVHHNAFDDARYQAAHLAEILAALYARPV